MDASADEDPVLARLLAVITEHGWAVRHVGPGGRVPAFSYTIGLTAMGHPEIVAMGLPFDSAQVYLNNIGHIVQEGGRFEHGVLSEEPGAPVAFMTADRVGGLTAVEQVYGHVTALQMIWTDSAGRFPWAVDSANAPDVQPLLGSLPIEWRTV